MYINDLSDNLTSTLQLFEDDNPLFSIVEDPNTSAKELNKDLQLVSECTYTWKMSFNADKNKQAQEVAFSRKQSKLQHPQLLFNNVPIGHSALKSTLASQHIKAKIQKAGIRINVIKKLNNLVPQQALLTIYKSFVRWHLDYGNIVYDQPSNENSCQRIETNQYKAALAIKGAIKETSKTKLY